MEALQQSLQRLMELSKVGLITQDEFEDRRKQLLDEFIGVSQLRALSLASGFGGGVGAGGGVATLSPSSAPSLSNRGGGSAMLGGLASSSRALHSSSSSSSGGVGLAGLMIGGSSSSSSSSSAVSPFVSPLTTGSGPGPVLGPLSSSLTTGGAIGSLNIKGVAASSVFQSSGGSSSSSSSSGASCTLLGSGRGTGGSGSSGGGRSPSLSAQQPTSTGLDTDLLSGTDQHAVSSSLSVKVQPLPTGTTREHLLSVFSQFGEVVSAVVNAGNPMYGYVHFTTVGAASAAKAAGSVRILNQTVAVRSGTHHRKPADEEPVASNGIGLFNIPYTTTRADLQSILMVHPGFQWLKMIYQKGGKFKGFAFAYFDTVENAIGCKNRLSGLTIRRQTIDIKFASKLDFPSSSSPF